MINKEPFFAEVIEGSLSLWKGQCWAWDCVPAFGTLVITNDENSTIWGVISAISTESIDQTHKPHAFGKTREELLRDHPHIFSLLQTIITCQTIGFTREGRIHYYASPRPPQIHSFIRLASADEQERILQDCEFLYPLLTGTPALERGDDLVLAFLSSCAELPQEKREAVIKKLMEKLSFIFHDDLNHLRRLTKRAEAILF